jgi:ACR3 family arsenite efflux pump ArsB
MPEPRQKEHPAMYLNPGVLFRTASAYVKISEASVEILTLSARLSTHRLTLRLMVAVGVFGLFSGETLVGVIGPLVEVSALSALVSVAFWMRGKYLGPHVPA